MKKRKNHTSKIMAGIALFAIIVGIVGTGILVLVQIISGPQNQVSQDNSYTPEQIQELIDAYSGSESNSSGATTQK